MTQGSQGVRSEEQPLERHILLGHGIFSILAILCYICIGIYQISEYNYEHSKEIDLKAAHSTFLIVSPVILTCSTIGVLYCIFIPILNAFGDNKNFFLTHAIVCVIASKIFFGLGLHDVITAKGSWLEVCNGVICFTEALFSSITAYVSFSLYRNLKKKEMDSGGQKTQAVESKQHTKGKIADSEATPVMTMATTLTDGLQSTGSASSKDVVSVATENTQGSAAS